MKSLRGEEEGLREVADRRGRRPLAGDGREEGRVHVWPCSMRAASPGGRWLPGVPGDVGSSYELGVPPARRV